MSPSSADLAPGTGQQFSISGKGIASPSVTWSVVEVGGGTVDATGHYMAPALAGVYHVQATSAGNPDIKAMAAITVPLTMAVTPDFVELRLGASQAFAATVTGAANTAVTWSVQETSGGTVDATGLYTAPATAGTYHVVATSAADPTHKAIATILVAAAASVNVNVLPRSAQLGKGGAAAFTATVEGSTNSAVTWSASNGTIDASGNYTAPSAFGTYTITATSVADPSVSDMATVVVSAQAGTDKSFTYDLNGNMTSDGARTFEWDAENRLVAVTIVATGHRSEFGYDGLGRRVEILEKDNNVISSDQKFLWDGVEIAEARNSTGATVQKRFYSQGFVDTDGTTLYYTRDHAGSIRELTDSQQSVRARYEYDPFGRVTKVTGDRDSLFQYAGYFWHAPSSLNLNFFRAYDPALGRWISRDPIQESDGLNVYVYVKNNPINYFDPLGLNRAECIKRAIDDARFAANLAIGVAAICILGIIAGYISTCEASAGVMCVLLSKGIAAAIGTVLELLAATLAGIVINLNAQIKRCKDDNPECSLK